MDDAKMYDLKLTNIPLLNLRMDFHNLFQTICSKNFYDQINDNLTPIELPFMIWGGMPGPLITYLLQKILTGAESYICGAVFDECGINGLLNKETINKIHNPFLLRGRSTTENFYNKLPSLVDPKLKLFHQNKALWDQVDQFYREIRNPIFHGNEIRSQNMDGIYKSFVLVADIYEWIDSWHSIEIGLMTGSSILSDTKNKFQPQWES